MCCVAACWVSPMPRVLSWDMGPLRAERRRRGWNFPPEKGNVLASRAESKCMSASCWLSPLPSRLFGPTGQEKGPRSKYDDEGFF